VSLAQKANRTKGLSGQGLSPQQQAVYDLLGKGFTVAEIASRLDISVRTVESYSARMIEKLHVHGMKELRRKAIAKHSAAAE
jgi:DNA-binding NarL/FixJ family response regulator